MILKKLVISALSYAVRDPVVQKQAKNIAKKRILNAKYLDSEFSKIKFFEATIVDFVKY